MRILSLTAAGEPPDDVAVDEDRRRFCEYLKRGFDGQAFCFAAEKISCPLGRYNLGVGPVDATRRDKLAKVILRWGDIGTIEAAEAYVAGLVNTDLDGRWIVVRPGDTSSEADLIVARGTPAEIMDLVARYTYHTGRTLRFQMGAIGASCGEIVAQALVTGSPALTLGCDGTRRYGALPDSDLMLGASPAVFATMRQGGSANGQ